MSEVFASTKSPNQAEERLKSTLGIYAAQIEKAATEISNSSGWKYGGLDLSPAPLMDVSIGRAIENFLGAPDGLQRNAYRGSDHHARAESNSGEAGRLFGIDAADTGRYGARATLERRAPLD